MIDLIDEKREKQLELIGELFKARLPQAAFLLEQEYGADAPRKIAAEVSEYFPLTFSHFEELVKDDVEDWWERELAGAFAMEDGDYLRPQV